MGRTWSEKFQVFNKNLGRKVVMEWSRILLGRDYSGKVWNVGRWVED